MAKGMVYSPKAKRCRICKRVNKKRAGQLRRKTVRKPHDRDFSPNSNAQVKGGHVTHSPHRTAASLRPAALLPALLVRRGGDAARRALGANPRVEVEAHHAHADGEVQRDRSDEAALLGGDAKAGRREAVRRSATQRAVL